RTVSGGSVSRALGSIRLVRHDFPPSFPGRVPLYTYLATIHPTTVDHKTVGPDRCIRKRRGEDFAGYKLGGEAGAGGGQAGPVGSAGWSASVRDSLALGRTR